jgi:hypothetical protein
MNFIGVPESRAFATSFGSLKVRWRELARGRFMMHLCTHE